MVLVTSEIALMWFCWQPLWHLPWTTHLLQSLTGPRAAAWQNAACVPNKLLVHNTQTATSTIQTMELITIASIVLLCKASAMAAFYVVYRTKPKVVEAETLSLKEL